MSKKFGCLFVYVCLLTGLCQGPQPIHRIAGYKVLLQSLLPGSLHSLESTVQVWRIFATWNARCWEMIVFAHALLLWRWLFSWLLFLTNGLWPPANHMLKGTRHRANFQKIPFASTFISQPLKRYNNSTGTEFHSLHVVDVALVDGGHATEVVVVPGTRITQHENSFCIRERAAESTRTD